MGKCICALKLVTEFQVFDHQQRKSYGWPIILLVSFPILPTWIIFYKIKMSPFHHQTLHKFIDKRVFRRLFKVLTKNSRQICISVSVSSILSAINQFSHICKKSILRYIISMSCLTVHN